MVPSEDEIADVFDRLVASELGVTPGPRERHDARAGRLRIVVPLQSDDDPSIQFVAALQERIAVR